MLIVDVGEQKKKDIFSFFANSPLVVLGLVCNHYDESKIVSMPPVDSMRNSVK